MKKISIVILLSSIFLTSCMGGDDTLAPLSATPENTKKSVIQEDEKENISSDDAKAETPKDTLETEPVIKTKSEATLSNF